MNYNKYKLDDKYYTSIENGIFDFMWNWQFTGRNVNHTVVDLDGAGAQNYGSPANEVDEFIKEKKKEVQAIESAIDEWERKTI